MMLRCRFWFGVGHVFFGFNTGFGWKMHEFRDMGLVLCAATHNDNDDMIINGSADGADALDGVLEQDCDEFILVK